MMTRVVALISHPELLILWFDEAFTAAEQERTDLGVPINSEIFPDDFFRSYVFDHFDVNKDMYLSDNEIRPVETIDVSDRFITDLKGIEQFTNLRSLYCFNNSLSALYIGSCDKLSSADMNIDRGVVLISDIAPDICVDTHITYEPEVETPVDEAPAVESPVVETTEEVATVDMYRLYNPNSGEHFFTASAGERDSLVAAGWSNEGIGWKAPVRSNTPVYRLYNQNGGEHHYTTSASERDFLVSNGWSDEGIGWYSDDNHGVPVYRQYNPNSFSNNHNYSTSASENDWLVSIGWQSEGIAWYGVA
ncbi:MAG: hypothetical protein K6F79_00135 [Saccharofermentans sp.]|nr:hypothetical protein [Saccharofermentans sp.]